jgi:hypothetical protein
MRQQTAVSKLIQSFRDDIENMGQDEAIKRFFNHHAGRALHKEMEQIESTYILGRDRQWPKMTAGEYFNGMYKNEVYPSQQRN